MKIEVGKLYRTRDGHKVRIYAIDGLRVSWQDVAPNHGAWFEENYGWIQASWLDDGSVSGKDGVGLDIVSEWEEPRPRLYAYLKLPERVVCFFPAGEPVTLSRKKDNEHFEFYEPAPWLDQPDSGPGAEEERE
jgi:hypothetical protein